MKNRRKNTMKNKKRKTFLPKATQENDSKSDGNEETKVEGFPTMEDSDGERETNRKLIQQQNRKKKKSGGFQSMGLSHSVFTGITRKGYKVPTPIQRKTIPLILDGKDVVAMARTGSGKTAAFLLPLFEKLKVHSAQSGARALIMSPTRELALQTLKFTKELGKYTGLRAAVILGGDKMEDQFAALHENPDIIIATPGRFLHVIVEMDLKLTSVEYVVFDEADRLFEMGFQDQLQETLKRLPDSRQTVLFSATLPKLLVEFARAGLHDPVLIRLDVDTKLSDQLLTSYFYCRLDDKCALLLHLLRNVIKKGEQTVVFVATKHHVEYLNSILHQAGIPCSYIYSSLDQTARKINIAKFQHKKTNVLLVTDLAARGIDIPMLDNVINFHFPAKGKLFVHRVGRVARAGRIGTAYSFVCPDETALFIDIHLFLGRPLKMSGVQTGDGLFGCVPQSILDDTDEELRAWHTNSSDLQNLKNVCLNGYKAYIRSRPQASKESIKRTKELDFAKLAVHPKFGTEESETQRIQLLESMKNYRPNSTIFEINSTTKTSAFSVMKSKRNKHARVIDATSKQKEDRIMDDQGDRLNVDLDMETIQSAFKTVVAPKRKATQDVFQPKRKKGRIALQIRDEENFLQYRPKDYETEKGLGLQTSFEREAAGAILDLTGDDEKQRQKVNNAVRWDRKKKKYVSMNKEMEQKKKIRTESGVWISASYKSNAYKDWMNKTKQHSHEDSDHSGDEGTDNRKGKNKVQIFGHGGRRKYLPDQSKFAGNKRKFKSEIKSKDKIVKERIHQEHKMKSQKRRQLVRQKRKGGGGMGKKKH